MVSLGCFGGFSWRGTTCKAARKMIKCVQIPGWLTSMATTVVSLIKITALFTKRGGIGEGEGVPARPETEFL